ncbi:gamma-glutamyltransferase [bacterium]|nr:gamma-glutamyltransferase [bacterium]
MMKKSFPVAIAMAICGFVTQAAPAFDRPAPNIHQTRSEVMAPHGVIATSHPMASAAGFKVLADGGNAIDAAVTAACTLGVVEPMMTGIGGDMFALVWSAKDKKLYGINASGWSGSKSTLEFVKSKGVTKLSSTGPLSITVPGAVDGFNQLMKKFGTIGMKRALAPAIDYAGGGVPVEPVILENWKNNAKNLVTPEAKAAFLIDGRLPKPGELFKNEKLAKTLKRLAARPDSFYRGDIAKEIAESMEKQGAMLTLADFNDYHAEWIEPISTTYRGVELFELPPNGQGIAALEMLNILEGFDLKSLGQNSAEAIHLQVEAKRLAYADLYALVADPKKAKVPVKEMLSKEYAAKRRALIDPNRAMAEPMPGISSDGDTVYLCAADKDGNMISMIFSIAGQFGSGVMAGETGILMQDRGFGFTLDPKHPNVLAPRKRPFHTIIPAMALKDGKPWVAYGVMGGTMQPQGHAQVLCNLVDFGMNIQQAGEAPRWRHETKGVWLESLIGDDVRKALAAKGHTMIGNTPPTSFGGYQGVMRNPLGPGWIAGSDPRKDGMAVGY